MSRYERERQEHQPHPGPSRPAWDEPRYQRERFRTILRDGFYTEYHACASDGEIRFRLLGDVWQWQDSNPGSAWYPVYNLNGTPDDALMVRS